MTTARVATIVFAIALCLLATGLIFGNYLHWSKFGNDFGVYWRVANQPLNEVYFWNGRFPFPYAPTMLLWVTPLAFIPKWVAYAAFVGTSIVAFVLACRPYLSNGAIALALISPHVARGLFTGQVCALLAALTIWACGTDNRRGAGIAFGIAASVKPQLVLMAPLMLALNRDFRALASASATFVTTLILSLLLFGPERWPEWWASMDHFRSVLVGTDIIEIATTPAAMAERFGYSPLPFLVLGAVFGAVIVYLCRDAPPIEKAAAIGLGSLMAAPYGLAYDLTVVAPFLALMILKGRFLAAIGIATAQHPLPLLISSYELVRNGFRPWTRIRPRPSLEPSPLA